MLRRQLFSNAAYFPFALAVGLPESRQEPLEEFSVSFPKPSSKFLELPEELKAQWLRNDFILAMNTLKDYTFGFEASEKFYVDYKVRMGTKRIILKAEIYLK
jgi:hypothetical protein